MKAQILIVGGGVMGTSLAIKTAQRTDGIHDPVVLLERSEIGAGSSGASGAILRQFYADRMVASMARDSLREYASFETRTARPIGFRRPGVLMMTGPEQANFEATRDLLRDQTAELRAIGIEVEYVEGEDIARLVPGMRIGRGVVGAWEPRGAVVDPKRTLESFAGLARSYGAITRVGVALEEILVESGRVVGARTTEGIVKTEKLVLVAGPWTRKILAQVGIDIPLKVITPENFHFALPDVGGDEGSEPTRRKVGFDIADLFDIGGENDDFDDAEPLAPHPVVIDFERDFYARCEPDQRRTRVGRIDYANHPVLDDPDDIEAQGRDELRAWARDVLTKRMPEYEGRADAGDVVSWYTLTPDAQAVIGPAPGIEGLYLAAGFSGHGFKLAPAIANGLTQMLHDEPVTAFDPAFFSPTRFEGVASDWSGCFGL